MLTTGRCERKRDTTSGVTPFPAAKQSIGQVTCEQFEHHQAHGLTIILQVAEDGACVCVVFCWCVVVVVVVVVVCGVLYLVRFVVLCGVCGVCMCMCGVWVVCVCINDDVFVQAAAHGCT